MSDPWPDYELSDDPCPKCGHEPTHMRGCERCGGEGWTDPAEDDPINYRAGYETEPCRDCACTGTEKWCPNCGEAMWHVPARRAAQEEGR